MHIDDAISNAWPVAHCAETSVKRSASQSTTPARRWRRRGGGAAWLVIGLFVLQACGGGGGGGGGGVTPSTESVERASVHHWNQIAIDASGLDHTTGYGQQFGPTRASRALAIVQIAVFNAVNAIAGGYQSYPSGLGLAPAPGASMTAAIAQAAHDTLAALFTLQAATFDAHLADELATIAAGSAKTDGINLGKQAAAAILALRANDGSATPEPHFGVDFVPIGVGPGYWQEDPISQKTVALGAYWGQVTPFVIPSGDHFRVPPPPTLGSLEYAIAYDEVRSLGGDGVVTPTVRNQDQTYAGLFWAYDGTPSLCAPTRLYNQITVTIADQQGLDVVHLARLLALANTAMADAAIAVWESKFYYQLWRPITAIREADPGLNSETIGDPTFTPLGAPASNLSGKNFTPPFPAYPSGHAGFGGALFQTLRDFFGTDNIPFTFVSDELNGVTLDNQGNVRPLVPRSFATFSEAAEENGQSRIYLGIHWAFDKDNGIAQGRQVGDYVFNNAFGPVQ